MPSAVEFANLRRHRFIHTQGDDGLYRCRCGFVLGDRRRAAERAQREVHISHLLRSGGWFWERTVNVDGHLIWCDSTNADGYGQVVSRGHSYKAHRIAWELVNGPVPEGLQLDHLCRITTCVQPTHLEPVTPRENVLRGESDSAANARKTHCSRGHEFTEANIIRNKRGKGRACRVCHLAWRRDDWRRKRDAQGTLVPMSADGREKERMRYARRYPGADYTACPTCLRRVAVSSGTRVIRWHKGTDNHRCSGTGLPTGDDYR